MRGHFERVCRLCCWSLWKVILQATEPTVKFHQPLQSESWRWVEVSELNINASVFFASLHPNLTFNIVKSMPVCLLRSSQMSRLAAGQWLNNTVENSAYEVKTVVWPEIPWKWISHIEVKIECKKPRKQETELAEHQHGKWPALSASTLGKM